MPVIYLPLETWSYESPAGDFSIINSKVINSRAKVGTIPGSQSSWGPRRLLLAGLCEAASSQAGRFRAELGAGGPLAFLNIYLSLQLHSPN